MAIEINATTVIINGKTIAISKKPKYMRGKSKMNFNTHAVGDEIKVTQSIDYTEAMGKVTLMLRNTLENINNLEDWQDNPAKNAIRIIDNETGFTKTFAEMSIGEDPEIDFDAEEFEVMFMGNAAS